MEQKLLGSISNAEIISTDKRTRTRGGTYISFLTDATIKKGDKLDIVIENKDHHFEVMEITIAGSELSIKALEVGYWATLLDRKNSFDLRSLIGLPVTLVEDKTKLAKIHEESCWC